MWLYIWLFSLREPWRIRLLRRTLPWRRLVTPKRWEMTTHPALWVPHAHSALYAQSPGFVKCFQTCFLHFQNRANLFGSTSDRLANWPQPILISVSQTFIVVFSCWFKSKTSFIMLVSTPQICWKNPEWYFSSLARGATTSTTRSCPRRSQSCSVSHCFKALSVAGLHP